MEITILQLILFGVIAWCILYLSMAILPTFVNFIKAVFKGDITYKIIFRKEEKVEEKIKNRYPATFPYWNEDEKINDYKNLPSEDEIQKYYKMYVKKFELDTQNIWTTQKHVTYKAYRERAKKLSEPVRLGKIIITRPGGYQFLISTTTDSVIRQPDNVIFVRYKDYQAMVEEDERNGRNFFDDEKVEMKDESLESKVKDQLEEIFKKNA